MRLLAFAFAFAPVACFGQPPKLETADTGGSTTTDPGGSTTTDPGSGSVTGAVDSSNTTDPVDTTGMPLCEPGGVPVPPLPDSWQGPFFGYGLSGGLDVAPDCGGGTRATPLGTAMPNMSQCGCVCEEAPEKLCQITMMACGVQESLDYGGDCLALELGPAEFTAVALTPCEGTLQGVPESGAPLGFRCEVVVENGCTSDSPMADGLCIFTDADIDACPPGYDTAGPFEFETLACTGSCAPCDNTSYCTNIVRMSYFDTADCSNAPTDPFVPPGTCPPDAVAGVRAAPVPAVCSPVQSEPTLGKASVCCGP